MSAPTTPDGHLDAELQELLDERLDPSARARAEMHLRNCTRCRHRLAALEATRAALRANAGEEEVPPALAERVRRALDREDAAARSALGRTRRRWAVGAAALAASVVAAVMLLRGRPPDIVAVVVGEYRTQVTELPPQALRTSDVSELQRFLGSAGLPFPVRVLDLGMMHWELIGGGIQMLEGRPSVVLAYRRDGRTVICRMYLASTEALPAGATIEEHRGFRFHVYERDGVTAVFWQEGQTVCVLLSDGPSREVVDLAIAKAMVPS